MGWKLGLVPCIQPCFNPAERKVVQVRRNMLYRNDCMIEAVIFRSFPQTEAATVEAELACAQHWGVVRLVVKELSITASVQLFDMWGFVKVSGSPLHSLQTKLKRSLKHLHTHTHANKTSQNGTKQAQTKTINKTNKKQNEAKQTSPTKQPKGKKQTNKKTNPQPLTVPFAQQLTARSQAGKDAVKEKEARRKLATHSTRRFI